MWRAGFKPKTQRYGLNSGRFRLAVALVFLLMGALMYKLFSVQIMASDTYSALAASQHEIDIRLQPERGQIFMTEIINGQEKLYPLASNRDFALLYAVPKDISDTRLMAERLYQFFEGRQAVPFSQTASSTSLASSSDMASLQAAKEEIIISYLKKLDKPGDPYEPLKNKMDSEELLSLYASLSSSSSPIKAEDLEIRSGKIIYKSNPSQSLDIPGLGFSLSKYRYYPEKEIGSHLLGFVSYSDDASQGRYGLEEFFNEELTGKYGRLKSERGEQGAIIVNNREYSPPEPGSDLILTIDRNVQFVACAKLKEAVKAHGADGGSVIVMDPKTGAIIAMCSLPDFDPNDYRNVKDIEVFNNPAVLYQYEPGSVFKTITMSIALDQGKVSPSTTYKDDGEIYIKGWPKPIRNSDFSTKGAHGVVDMNFVLENSLNTGSIFAMRQAGAKVFADYVKHFGFGEKTGIELGSESSGDIRNLEKNKIKEIDAATASFGQGIAATPLQMIMSYQVFANQGILMKPYIVKAIVKNGHREEINPKPIGRIVTQKTAATILAMLVNVVEKGHSKRSAIDGYYIGGKTGTAQVAIAGGYSKDKYVHTYIGIVPIDDPAFVMLTKIDAPKDVEYAEGSAVPLWRDIADYILKYYQVPKDRK